MMKVIVAVLVLIAALSAPVVYGQIEENPEECPTEFPEDPSFSTCVISFPDFISCSYEPEIFCCPETGECVTYSCNCDPALGCCASCFAEALQEECLSVTESCPTELPAEDFDENFSDFCVTNDVQLSYTCPIIVTSDCCPETGECLEKQCSCSETSTGTCSTVNTIECPSLCPAEKPEDDAACSLSESYICLFEPDEPPACFEESTTSECSCSFFGLWDCFDSTEINLDPSCGPIEQLCPADPPIENDSCDIPFSADCAYETADFCCPETGNCTEIKYSCSSFTGWTVSRPLGLGGDRICPSLCPADSLEANTVFTEACLSNGFRYNCPYKFENEEACCPETGECAIELDCQCSGDQGFCSDGIQKVSCPSQFLCPEEPPQEGTPCRESEYFFNPGACNYYTPENPECFEEVVRELCFCDFLGLWICVESQGPFIDETCDFTPSELPPSAIIAPSMMPVVAPVPAPVVAPTASPTQAPTTGGTTCPPGFSFVPGLGCVCFDGDAKVETPSGTFVAMRDLQVGDEVLVNQQNNKFERVYDFGHASSDALGDFVAVSTSSKTTLHLSSSHMIRVEGGSYVPASSLSVGDALYNKLVVTSMNPSTQKKGVYAPFTPSGTIVVDGMEASCYVSFSKTGSLDIAGISFSGQWLAHTFEFPHRVACHYLGRTCQAPTNGVSPFVKGPLEFFHYIVHEASPTVFTVVMASALPLLVLFSVTEFFVFMQPILLVAALAAIVAARRVKSKTIV